MLTVTLVCRPSTVTVGGEACNGLNGPYKPARPVRPIFHFLCSTFCNHSVLEAAERYFLNSGQTETVSVRFLPKISACFGFRYFRRNTILATHFSNCQLPKQPFMAEIRYFGRKSDSTKISVLDKISAFSRGLVLVSVFRPKICFI